LSAERSAAGLTAVLRAALATTVDLRVAAGTLD
jgi:hypothetical protein